MHNFRELNIWKESLQLSIDISKLCNSFPDEEKFGLASQIRRSSVSIPSNIAEGSSRDSSKDFSRFLRISLGSSYELETKLIMAVELDYLSGNEELFDRLNKIQRQIFNFSKSLNNSKK